MTEVVLFHAGASLPCNPLIHYPKMHHEVAGGEPDGTGCSPVTWGRGAGSARSPTSGWRGIRGAIETLDETGGVNDGGRIAYLAAYTKLVEAAIASGADVRGYFTWSILDNLEWGAGFANRLGLVYVDYATQRRVPKTSFDWFAKLIWAQQHGDHA